MFHGLYRVSPSVSVFWLSCWPEFGCVKIDCMRIASRRKRKRKHSMFTILMDGFLRASINQECWGGRVVRCRCRACRLCRMFNRPGLCGKNRDIWRLVKHVANQLGHGYPDDARVIKRRLYMSECHIRLFTSFFIFLCFNVFWVHRYDENNGFLFLCQ